MGMTSSDVIRFRVTQEERARIQAMADRLTGGNVSRLIKRLLDQADESQPPETEIHAVIRIRGDEVTIESEA